MFSGGVGTDGMSQALTQYFRDRNWTRIGLISSTDASGQDFEKNFDAAMATAVNGRLHLVTREHFAVSDLSVNAQIARMKSARPDVVIVWTAGTGLGVALHGVHDVGLDVPVVAGNGNMVRAQLKQYQGFLPKTLLFPGILGMVPATGGSAAVRAAQTRYFTAYAREGLKPDLPGALSWDPTDLLLDAYRAEGWNATAAQLREWISSQRHWAGVNGTYDFAKYPQRGIGQESCVVDRWNPQSGDFVAVSKPGGARL
jgi:branched-chain amino acid transport system substrate-binding protein